MSESGSSDAESVDVTSVDTTHDHDMKSFLHNFNQAVGCVLPPAGRHYEKVSVLLVSWADDDLGTEQEICDLQDVFHNLYHYETKRFIIPSKRSETKFARRLINWQDANESEDNLLILYYGGHGKVEKDYGGRELSVWQAHLGEGSPQLVWSHLQRVLEQSEASVLFILDCCHAQAAAYRGSGTKEGLWACDSESKAIGVEDNSFTQNVIQELKELYNTRFTVPMLHQRLLQRETGSGLPRLLRGPCHTTLGSAVTPSIELFPYSQAPPNDDITVDMELPLSETVVLVGIHLQNIETIPNQRTWQSWLHGSAPEEVNGVMALARLPISDLLHLQGCYRSHSVLLLLSMPICIWDRMPSRQAYSFISYISSADLAYVDALQNEGSM